MPIATSNYSSKSLKNYNFIKRVFKSSNSYCLSKWGKTMTTETFNEFTDIKGRLVESNSKYIVKGKNYSSRWIQKDWWYFNKSTDLDYIYGESFIVGPVDSAFDTVEAYADLSGYLVLDSDDDGWRGTTKYVETACYNPKP